MSALASSFDIDFYKLITYYQFLNEYLSVLGTIKWTVVKVTIVNSLSPIILITLLIIFLLVGVFLKHLKRVLFVEIFLFFFLLCVNLTQ